MMGQPGDVHIIALSLRIYQLLLVAYPARFRQEYSSHMSQVFRDCCLRTVQCSGTNGMVKLWAITLLDLVQSVISEHRQKEAFMTRSKFIRMSGWSLMLGAVTFFLFALGVQLEYGVYDPFRRLDPFIWYSFLAGVWVSPILLAVGMLGLRARYGYEVGSFGRNILLLGAVAGPAINIIGVYATPRVDWGWILLFAGPAVLLATSPCWRVALLSSLPRWNGLPLFAGIWYPVLLFTGLVSVAVAGPGSVGPPIMFAVVALQSIALFFLGYILRGDVAETAPALA
jgi:hypothetical protein